MNQPLGESPLVSIVTPSFNQGRYIAETIESILAQDYPNIEYLVVDGASTDSTLEILHKYNGRVSWVSEPDRNQSNAINKGFARTRGAILAWLNSDDVLLPGAVTRVVEEFKTDEELGLVYGASRLVDAYGKEIGEALSLEPDLWTMLFLADHVPQPSAFFRRDAFERVGSIDESLRYCMDYEFFIRLFVDGPIRRIPDMLSASRIYDSTLSLSGGYKRYREIATMVRRHSGATFPPACANYAIDWVEHLAQRFLRRAGSGRFIAAALRVTEETAAAGYRQVRKRSNPNWQDRWVGRDTRFLVRKDDGEFLEIIGEVPPQSDGTAERILEIHVDGARLDRAVLPAGPFHRIYAFASGSAKKMSRNDVAISRVREIRVKTNWESAVDRSIDDATPRDVRRLSWRADTVEARRVLPELTERSSGWYADAWASPLVSVIVYEPGSMITITGRLPHEFEQLRGQRLRIEVAGRCMYEEVLEFGDFTVSIEAPDPRVSTVQLFAVKWVDPRQANRGDGPRRLSYLLYEAGGVRRGEYLPR